MKLTTTQLNALRRLAGDKQAPWPKLRQNAQKVVWSLIDRELIHPIGWNLTDLGKEVLSNPPDTSR
ncbi:hypothetical protein NKI86_31755 [Mesorhizobium sp. M0320]|uniref:hypothetical protein n=1 Tax=Mesorhizobium sp. M0320 TaxID=2956936 RepID=UPI0033396E92